MPLPISDEFRNLILAPESSYVTVYSKGLSLSHYNFSLQDYAYFQFSWTPDSDLRYAYYPNPFASGSPDRLNEFEELRENLRSGSITYEEYSALLRDQSVDSRIPAIRYEHAPSQYRPLDHPCSHFHIGSHVGNRWAINRILTPVAFTLFILKQYYGPAWRGYSSASGDGVGDMDSRLIGERANCRRISESHFSSNEALSFHFT